MENVPVRARGLMSGILQQGYAVGYLCAACVNLSELGFAFRSHRLPFCAKLICFFFLDSPRRDLSFDLACALLDGSGAVFCGSRFSSLPSRICSVPSGSRYLDLPLLSLPSTVLGNRADHLFLCCLQPKFESPSLEAKFKRITKQRPS